MVLVLSSIMFSCSKEEENVLVPADFGPEFIYMYVTDEAGNDLVSEDVGLTLTWRNVTYEVKPSKNASDLATRAYLPHLYGLYIEPSANPNEPSRIVFGELSGSKSDDDFILKWSDGSTNVIHYYAHLERTKNDYKLNRYWKLDEEMQKSNKFYFVKKK